MGLSAYHHKRHFARTPEPRGTVTATHTRRFVVHEHHASHLHYDLRLEMAGVLKSWAVPKGPTLDPRQKRLAVMVEDHPIEYLAFHGHIAEGNYGAGEVKIWDTGRYEVSGADAPAQQLDAGKLSIVFHGKKLRGLFHLVQVKGKERQWLLIKGRDETAKPTQHQAAHARNGRADERETLVPKPIQPRARAVRVPSSSPAKAAHLTETLSRGVKQSSLASARRAVLPTTLTPTLATDKDQFAHTRTSERRRVVSLPHALQRKDLSGDLTLKVAGHTVTLTHLEREYWPGEGYRKADLLRYYYTVAPVLLPYLKQRPLILKRYPSGITGQSFYQHDVDMVPDFVTTCALPTEGGKVIDYVICNNVATLLYLGNLGTIAPHPWHSRVQSIDHPDWIIFDLDPHDVAFAAVQELALGLKEILDRLGLDSYPKTSGAAGMHVYVPIASLYNYQQVAQFAELVAQFTMKQYPQLVTLERSLSKRKRGRIYLDYLQNARGKSVVAPYSVRAETGATVSTPLTWAEVGHPLSPQEFTIMTLTQRLTQHGDLFTPVLTQKQELGHAVERLDAERHQDRGTPAAKRKRR